MLKRQKKSSGVNALTLKRFIASTRGKASIFSPHVARQNIELSPIFCDGAARDRNAAVAHILDEHVSLRTRHSSINFAEISLARRTRLFDALPSVEMKFAKQQFSALGQFEITVSKATRR